MKKIRFNPDHGLTYLFVSLITLLILLPAGHSIELVRYAIDIIFTLMVTEILYQHVQRNVLSKTLTIISIASVLMIWISTFYQAPKNDIIYSISHLIFYTYLAYILAVRVMSSKTFNNNTIFGSLSIYISAGFAWGYLYALLKIFDSSSFAANYPIPEPQAIESMVYFSFISITTLGYGNIYPVSPLAGSIVILEVIFGQIFFAVVIAKIVSLSLAANFKSSTKSAK